MDSSMIAGIGYNKASQEMFVRFRLKSGGDGALWKYADVPEHVYRSVITADSVGSAFIKSVRGKFPGTKLG